MTGVADKIRAIIAKADSTTHESEASAASLLSGRAP